MEEDCDFKASWLLSQSPPLPRVTTWVFTLLNLIKCMVNLAQTDFRACRVAHWLEACAVTAEDLGCSHPRQLLDPSSRKPSARF